jgi:hypothetical protein
MTAPATSQLSWPSAIVRAMTTWMVSPGYGEMRWCRGPRPSPYPLELRDRLPLAEAAINDVSTSAVRTGLPARELRQLSMWQGEKGAACRVLAQRRPSDVRRITLEPSKSRAAGRISKLRNSVGAGSVFTRLLLSPAVRFSPLAASSSDGGVLMQEYSVLRFEFGRHHQFFLAKVAKRSKRGEPALGEG